MNSVYIFLTLLEKLPLILSSGLLRTDYYISLSDHSNCLVFSHYFPSGPLFLYVEFTYNLYSFIYGYQSKNLSFDNCFKKIDRKCNNSLYVTTMEKNFRKLNLVISIYLFKNHGHLAQIIYTLYRGIPSGKYELWDYFKSFSIHLHVLNEIKNYLVLSICSFQKMKSYLNKILYYAGDLCLITENNAVVLNKESVRSMPNGLITYFNTYFYFNKEFIHTKSISSFMCNKTIDNPDDLAIFIIDKPKLDIVFKVMIWKISNDLPTSKEYEIKIYNFQFAYVDNLEYISATYKKVFLFKYDPIFIQCQDDTYHITLFSNNHIPYKVFEFKNFNISSTFEHRQVVFHSLYDQC